MSSEGTVWDWEESVREILGRKGASAGESAITGFLRGQMFGEFTETVSKTAQDDRRGVPIAMLPEAIARGKPLLVVNCKIAAKLRVKHKIRHEEYLRLQGMLKQMKWSPRDYVETTGKGLRGGRYAPERYSGWVRSRSKDAWGYAIVWSPKEDRSELVTFYRLKTERDYEKHMKQERGLAAAIKRERG